MKKIALLSFLLIQVTGLFSLEIPNPKINFNAKMEDRSYEFEFKVVNNTQQIETVDSVSGGCSCISVICNKMRLNPGESATVTGSFDFQTNVGKQRKLIYIKTGMPGSDPKADPIQNEYKMILEGEIPSPLKISKSALIWIDGDKLDEKKVIISIKSGFVVSAISVEKDKKSDVADNFLISKTEGADQVCKELSVTPKTTDLGSLSSNFRDVFCRLNINYIVESDGKKINRTERLDLLLAKKPGKKYENEKAYEK